MFPELSLCVKGQESECPFRVNAYESEYSKIDESGNIYESGKISSSVNVISVSRVTDQNYFLCLFVGNASDSLSIPVKFALICIGSHFRNSRI